MLCCESEDYLRLQTGGGGGGGGSGLAEVGSQCCQSCQLLHGRFNVRVFLCLRKLQTTTTPIHSNIVTVSSLYLLLHLAMIISNICQ